MSGRKSRDKGARGEREVVGIILEAGLSAEKQPLSGALGGKWGGDISAALLGQDRRIEVKRRAKLPEYLQLGTNYAVLYREDRGEWFVHMRLRDALEVAAVAEKNKNDPGT